MDRRTLLIAAAAALSSSRLSAFAQEATPTTGGLSGLGLPELSISVTDSAYEGIPDEVTAGRYLLRSEAGEGDNSVGFLKLPEGMDVEGFLGALEESSEAPPEWYFTTELAGGVSGPGAAVIELTPGDWIAWGDNPMAQIAPFAFTVTGEAEATPSASADIPADVTITMFEYGFEVEGQLRPGQQTLEVVNIGAQPHFLLDFMVPDRITGEQIMRVLELDMTGGTPEAGEDLPDPDSFQPGVYVPTLSTGRRQWHEVDFQPGWHVLICFVPDLASGQPHAMLGMYDVIEIGGSATPTS